MAYEIIRSVFEPLFGAACAFAVYHGLKTGSVKNMWRGWTLRSTAPFAFYLTLLFNAALSLVLIYDGISRGSALLFK